MNKKINTGKKEHLSFGEAGRGLSIVKIGGNIIENDAELKKFLRLFSKMKGHKILVHGGGRKTSEVLKRLGITPKMHEGRRITDEATLDVAIMVYGGLTNKKIVAQLQVLNCNALGMSGADANVILAHKRPVSDIDYGFAGDVETVNKIMVSRLLKLGITPVFCALTHDKKGQLLNTNADTIAAELAGQMSQFFQTTLFYCFEKNGVLENIDDDSSVIKNIDSRRYTLLLDKGIISDGMLPKIQNCFHALEKGADEVRIGNLALFEENNTNYTSLVL